MEEKHSLVLNGLLLSLAGILDRFLSFIGMDAKVLFILILLMSLDMVTGIAKCRTLGIDITSYRLRMGFISKIFILFIPLILALISKGIAIDFNSFVTFCLNVLIISEGYSALGNIYTFKTGARVKEIDAVSYLIKKVRELLQSFLKDL